MSDIIKVDAKTKRILSIIIAGINSGLMIASFTNVTLPPIVEKVIMFTDATLTAILRGQPLPSPSIFFEFESPTPEIGEGPTEPGGEI